MRLQVTADSYFGAVDAAGSEAEAAATSHTWPRRAAQQQIRGTAHLGRPQQGPYHAKSVDHGGRCLPDAPRTRFRDTHVVVADLRRLEPVVLM